MLQVFTSYSSPPARAADFLEFARLGFYPRGLAALPAQLLPR
jgi:hypothetical protein